MATQYLNILNDLWRSENQYAIHEYQKRSIFDYEKLNMNATNDYISLLNARIWKWIFEKKITKNC